MRPERRHSFTFAEILVAMAFVAIVLPVAVRGVLTANRIGVVAERKRVAARLADRVLTDLVATGDWAAGSQAGDFGQDWPAYCWRVDDVPWEESDESDIRLVTVEVSFVVTGEELSVVVSSLALASD